MVGGIDRHLLVEIFHAAPGSVMSIIIPARLAPGSDAALAPAFEDSSPVKSRYNSKLCG